jgi:hypothetical protein
MIKDMAGVVKPSKMAAYTKVYGKTTNLTVKAYLSNPTVAATKASSKISNATVKVNLYPVTKKQYMKANFRMMNKMVKVLKLKLISMYIKGSLKIG